MSGREGCLRDTVLLRDRAEFIRREGRLRRHEVPAGLELVYLCANRSAPASQQTQSAQADFVAAAIQRRRASQLA
jgi:hypothetical protein